MGCGASKAPAAAAQNESAPAKPGPTPPASTKKSSAGGAGASGAAAAPPAPKGGVVYVLGNEACGKEEICSRLAAEVGGSYLSATVLLRSAVESDTEEGHKLSEMIKQGKIVPAATTTQLLTTAMARLPAPYLIDGFPKSLDNMSPFEDQVGACKLALLFELSDELSRQRMAAQGKQEELIQRKLRNFATQTLPIAQALEGRQLLRKISAAEVRVRVRVSAQRCRSRRSSSGRRRGAVGVVGGVGGVGGGKTCMTGQRGSSGGLAKAGQGLGIALGRARHALARGAPPWEELAPGSCTPRREPPRRGRGLSHVRARCRRTARCRRASSTSRRSPRGRAAARAAAAGRAAARRQAARRRRPPRARLCFASAGRARARRRSVACLRRSTRPPTTPQAPPSPNSSPSPSPGPHPTPYPGPHPSPSLILALTLAHPLSWPSP